MKYLKYLESKKFGFLKVKKNKIQLYSRITDIPAVGKGIIMSFLYQVRALYHKEHSFCFFIL